MAKHEFTVGSHVELETESGDALKGEVFAFDKYTRTVVLKELPPSETVHLINAQMIKTPPGVTETKKAPSGLPAAELPFVDPDRSSKKELEAVKAREAAAQKIGEGVTKEGQAMYEAIGKTMPVAWDGKTIVVLGEVRVVEPYESANATSGSEGETTLKRVKMVIEAERSKLNMA
mmetsp:Transcript_23210/g.64454  ORF Transcript_23210/g.64454 Transcript_23210/m.64454 type:complete len:175 (+) Transcript_23210:125-649(+)|eukprot:CAMPEP_0117668654 /NCGR_PEP_ID=MMETSP0804-20121206/11676_1 /TAXON_ID=1074897 /ORGANISM="Tetraselmis astigmatica, Strain CCMP880" /LENGTH=174 /DNA_ID=CAMNT_0005476583 /DNA_START=98 /DNA_END=622 /DNA_ORIENTATION=+